MALGVDAGTDEPTLVDQLSPADACRLCVSSGPTTPNYPSVNKWAWLATGVLAGLIGGYIVARSG